jgi:hypothetical protein
MGERSRRNLWQRNSRPICVGGNSKPPHHIQQDTEKCCTKDIRKESIRKWQSYWQETSKGTITKEFFPNVESRLALNCKLSPDVTTIVTGHGNIRSYLHILKIIGSPVRPCNNGIQRVDHLILQCRRLRNERAILKSSVLKEDKWPVSKIELTNRNLKQFINYINSMDLVKINQSNE